MLAFSSGFGYCLKDELPLPARAKGALMNKQDARYAAYTKILQDELKVAMGCTVPISVAYACALAR